MQFRTDEPISLTINMDEQDMKQKYPELRRQMDGFAYDVISKIFRAITKKKVIVSGTFKSKNAATSVKCSLKANDGYLYPLESSFFFIRKPPTYISMTTILM